MPHTNFFYRNYYSIILCIITLIGAVCRLYGFFDLPFTHDEISAATKLHYTSFSQLIDSGIRGDGHPAGVQVFLWYWSKLFGYSEIVLRIPFLLMGIACIPLSYVVSKLWFNKNTALFVAGFLSLSQIAIFHSLTIRPYIAGLFFTLLMLYYWSKIIFTKDYRWKNVILMGIFVATSAYIHHFSMLFAALLGISGLFFLEKRNVWKYLLACMLAIVLYIPHIPILLHQMQIGGVGGPDGWLAKPTPEFFIIYPKYLFHFSRYVYLIIAMILIYSTIVNFKGWTKKTDKRILALTLFLLPLLIAYVYSIYINSVLQFSVLIFFLPFFLMLLFSNIDENRHILKIVFLILMMGSMLYSLIYQRKHYEIMPRQWYELSAKKAFEYQQCYGSEMISYMLNMEKPFLNYYETKYNDSIYNLIYKEQDYSLNAFYRIIEQQKSNYILVAGLSDPQLRIIKEKYPYLIEYEKCYTSEIFLFSKTKSNSALAIDSIYAKNVIFDSLQIDSSHEFIPIASLPFLEINDSRFTSINLNVNYIAQDTHSNIYLVLETKYNDMLKDWRAVETKNFTREVGVQQDVFLSLRYELLFKNSRKMKDVSIHAYLWNPDKTAGIVLLNSTITAYKDNEYIYGLVECLQ